VDVSQVEFIASLGIGMLLRAAKALERHQAKLVIVAAPELVAHTLTTARIDRIIPMAQDRQQADELLGVG
jgi:anti-anti-sigma factor